MSTIKLPDTAESTSSNGRRRPRVIAGAAALVLSTALLSACTHSASAGAGASAAPATTGNGAPPPSSIDNPAQALQQSYESVIKHDLPSIVQITTSSGLGSGIVYDNAGDIVTNDHVVGSATSFQVQLADSATPVPASLVGTFPADDLAVIRISGAGSNLHPATFADSSQVRVGEIVLAMGNPLGLTSSVTNGIVSAVGRTLTEPNSPDSPGATLPDSIQTSAAINPGNSGGALVDLQGNVVGIPTLAATDQQQGGAAPGIGFAIPANTVTKIAGQLIKDGRVTDSGRAALGIQAATVTDASGAGVGVGVASVKTGGAAAAAGIKPGDVIIKINGAGTPTVQALSAVLAGLKVGQKVQVVLDRAGQSHTLQVTLGQL
ncbi:MAG TPA: trypsin-like peptidase domain-containing protein [Jatrophihabitans sp.]|nr:trypsin-like peptidase domain-containing protein [Jatrophihabitans sp.]